MHRCMNAIKWYCRNSSQIWNITVSCPKKKNTCNFFFLIFRKRKWRFTRVAVACSSSDTKKWHSESQKNPKISVSLVWLFRRNFRRFYSWFLVEVIPCRTNIVEAFAVTTCVPMYVLWSVKTIWESNCRSSTNGLHSYFLVKCFVAHSTMYKIDRVHSFVDAILFHYFKIIPTVFWAFLIVYLIEPNKHVDSKSKWFMKIHEN